MHKLYTHQRPSIVKTYGECLSAFSDISWKSGFAKQGFDLYVDFMLHHTPENDEMMNETKGQVISYIRAMIEDLKTIERGLNIMEVNK